MTTRALKTLASAALAAGMLGFTIGTIAAERHPEINRAERALRNAKTDLEHAAHDFGGHRVAAIQFIDQALHELQEAKQFDKQ